MLLDFELIKYTPINRARTLLGFIEIFLPSLGLYFRGFRHCKRGENEWITAPRQFIRNTEGGRERLYLIDFETPGDFHDFTGRLLETVHQYLKGEANKNDTENDNPRLDTVRP